MPDKKKTSNVRVIKEFFEKGGGRKVTITEFKELTPDDKNELGQLCAEELGQEIG